jgi:serine/threonine protein kinase
MRSFILFRAVLALYFIVAAPEVLLSGGKYKTSVDVWSVGCVLAELLLRRPLFPGENYLHQLQLITEVLGSPSEDDLHFVRSDAAKSFMLRLPKYEGVPISKLFSHVRGPCLDLVQQMLVFDPDKRISVDDALAHPFLARVRSARRALNEEAVPIPRPFKLRIAGGSSGLRTMAVDVIKARFYAELCGMLSPTPTSPPAGELFDIAAIAGADGLDSLPVTASGAGMDYSASAPPSQSADADEMPKEWGVDGEEATDELGYFEDDEMSSPSSGRSPNRRSSAAATSSSPAFGSRSMPRTR